MPRTRKESIKRPRSTCNRPWDIHGAHNWQHGDQKLWCPGTDGSNPQIPDALRAALRAADSGE